MFWGFRGGVQDMLSKTMWVVTSCRYQRFGRVYCFCRGVVALFSCLERIGMRGGCVEYQSMINYCMRYYREDRSSGLLRNVYPYLSFYTLSRPKTSQSFQIVGLRERRNVDLLECNVKVKLVPVHAVKTCWDVTARIFNLEIGGRWEVNFTPCPHSRSLCIWEDAFLSDGIRAPDHPARRLVTLTTTLPRLSVGKEADQMLRHGEEFHNLHFWSNILFYCNKILGEMQSKDYDTRR